MRSRLPVERRILRNDARHLGHAPPAVSLTVASSLGSSDGRRGMYSGRASIRSSICCTAWNTGACSGSGGWLKASRGASSSAYATNRRSASLKLMDATGIGRCGVPVRVRLEPVVEEMASGSGGAGRLARPLSTINTATTATTTTPINTATEPVMLRGYPIRAIGPPVMCRNCTGFPQAALAMIAKAYRKATPSASLPVN